MAFGAKNRVAKPGLWALVALCTALALPAASSAAAIDMGVGSEQPSVAHDPATNTTYAVWSAPGSTSIELCVVPAGATVCTGGAALQLTDPLAAQEGTSPTYFQPQVVVEPSGEALVVAHVEPAAKAAQPAGYAVQTGVIGWASAAGGAGFSAAGQGLLDGGKLLSPNGNEHGYGEPPAGGAVALGTGTAAVGVLGDAAPHGNGFAAFASGQEAPAALPRPDTTGNEGLGSYQEDLFASGSRLAAVLNSPAPGEDLVVAVSAGVSPAYTGCPGGSENYTGFGVADTGFGGLDLQKSWGEGGAFFKPISCQADSVVDAAGGGSLGLLENEGPVLHGGSGVSIDYRPFETALKTFGAPVEISDETTQTLGGAVVTGLAMDSSGAAYASWSDRRGHELDYSATPGGSWPAPRNSGLPEQAGDIVLAALGAGNAEAAYTANLGAGAHEYLQAISYPTGNGSGPSATTTFQGEHVTLSGPKQCIKNGKVTGTLLVKIRSHKRKGRVVVKIYKVIFKVGGASKAVSRRKLSNKPFVGKLTIKSPKAGEKYVLSARAFIAVKHGPPRSKTLHIVLTTCA
jgi:hypothetical protein